MEWPKKLRKTRHRKCLLSILEQADTPLTVLEIHQKMESLGEKVWLSTIYRILEQFEEHNVIIKNPISNDEVAVYALNQSKHIHYAKCMNCNKIFSMENCPLEKFNPQIEDKSFQVVHHKVEIFGYCNSCKK